MMFSKKVGILSCSALLWMYLCVSAEVISVPSVGVQSISQAMLSSKNGDTIYVSDGVYHEHIFIKAGISLKARNSFKAIIDGGGKGTVVTLSVNSLISGFEIRNGTIGVFSKDINNAILNCRIVKHWSTGIICVRHLPKIEDNIIAFNKASGIQGWDVRGITGSINHNTIAFNGNNGIAIGGISDIIIENNMVTFNERFGIKLSASSEKSQLNKNNVFGNLTVATKLSSGTVAFDPKFTSPRAKLDFTVESKAPCCAYGSDNKVLGIRPID